MNHLGSMATSILSLNNEEPVIKKPDLCHLCRLCAHAHEYLIPIFQGEGIDHDLAMKIKKYLPISVGDDDNLPGQVCYQCASTLIAWHDLFLGCIDADHKLRKLLLENHKDKNETAECIQNGEKNFTVENLTSEISLKLSDSLFSQSNEKIDHHCINEDVIPSRIVAVDSHERLQSLPPGSFKENSVYESSQEYKILNTCNGSKDIQNSSKQTDSGESWEPEILLEENIEHDAEEKPHFECEYCGKRVSTRGNMITHLRIHTGEYPYTCHICGKRFRSTSGFKRHLREVHEGVKDQVCKTCGRSFANKRTLEDHQRIHTGERPFVCELCSKSFKTKASLYIHRKGHSNIFPYKCIYCNRGFRIQSKLALHVLQHTGEKPHECNVCGRTFRLKYELGKHTLIHTNFMPFSCNQCGHKFRQERYLRNHTRNFHKINTQEKVY